MNDIMKRIIKWVLRIGIVIGMAVFLRWAGVKGMLSFIGGVILTSLVFVHYMHSKDPTMKAFIGVIGDQMKNGHKHK